MSLTNAPARPPRVNRGERGQLLIMFVVFLTVIFVAAALAIDYTRWLSERRGVARAADLAALAAVQDMPADPGTTLYTTAAACDIPSCDAAFQWAERNGYREADGAAIRVSYFCGNEIKFPPPGICENEGMDTPLGMSPCPSAVGEVGCDAINVRVEKGAVKLFFRFFGDVVGDFDIGYESWASVTFRIAPLDTVMSIDASGSMGDGCTPAEDNPGCPIREARIAADEFVTILLGDDPETGNVQIGYAPYRGCYEPPSNDDDCVPSLDFGDCDDPPVTSWVLCLTKDADLLREKFAATDPDESTNVCLGLWQSGEILDGPGQNTTPGAQRFIVLLTDGENAFQNVPGIPDDCDPTSGGGPPCAGGGNDELRLDRCTENVADDLKAAGVEIYVIGLNVSGTDDGDVMSNADCNNIGNGADDDVANRRLLKCIASSTGGTNDHYYETNNAIELGNIFQGVAYEIAGRGLAADEN